MKSAFLFAAVAACLAATSLAATPADALPLPGTGLSVAGEVALLSDYRFRGVSRSDEDPALHGNVVVSHRSGFYVGTRANTLDGIDPLRLRDPRLDELGDVQLDLYAGYGADLGAGLSVDAGLLYYVFAGGEGATDYAEPYASFSYLLGPVEATLGAKYAPSQRAIGDEDMFYAFGELRAGIPFTPVTISAQAGRQEWGAFGSYWNWSVGGRYAIGPADLGLRYVDTDLAPIPGQDAGLVLSLGLRF